MLLRRFRCGVPGLGEAEVSLSHIAHGADGVLFFQWRASRAGAEQFHSAMVPHAGEGSVVFRDVCRLGENLRQLAPVLGSKAAPARAGILFDDEAGWAMHKGVKPHNHLRYGRIVRDWHHALWRLNEPVDVLSPWQDLINYELVVVPALFLVSDEDADRVRRFVDSGGTAVVTHLSGIVDVDDQVRLGGYPGTFCEMLGAWCEEFRPLQDGERFTLDNGWAGTEWTELVRTSGADVLARYTTGALAGQPAITARTADGGGRAIYVSAHLDRECIAEFVRTLVPASAASSLPRGVEVAVRESANERFTFVINHGAADVRMAATGRELLEESDVKGELLVPAGEVRVVQTPRVERP